MASVLAESYERLGDVEEADANYREAQRLDPENAGLRRDVQRVCAGLVTGQDRQGGWGYGLGYATRDRTRSSCGSLQPVSATPTCP